MRQRYLKTALRSERSIGLGAGGLSLPKNLALNSQRTRRQHQQIQCPALCDCIANLTGVLKPTQLKILILLLFLGSHLSKFWIQFNKCTQCYHESSVGSAGHHRGSSQHSPSMHNQCHSQQAQSRACPETSEKRCNPDCRSLDSHCLVFACKAFLQGRSKNKSVQRKQLLSKILVMDNLLFLIVPVPVAHKKHLVCPRSKFQDS